MIGEQLERSLPLRLHSRKHAFRERVWNALGIELRLDPSVDAERFDTFDVAGPCAEGQTTEYVCRLLGRREVAMPARRCRMHRRF